MRVTFFISMVRVYYYRVTSIEPCPIKGGYFSYWSTRGTPKAMQTI